MNPSQLVQLWNRLSSLPGGSYLFKKAISFGVPYSGSIRPMVQELRPGYCRLTIQDRRAVRNHLECVHAVALVNMGELCSGLAFLASFPANFIGIVVSLRVEYLKKARGTLTATSTSPTYDFSKDGDCEVICEITNEAKEVVCKVYVQWKLKAKK